MTENGTMRQLVAERNAAYAKRGVQLTLRGAVLDAAEAAGVRPEDSLPPQLQAAHAAYTAEIGRLNDELAGLDQMIADGRTER